VTITHEFGETKVPPNPSRVVTVGWTDQDFALPFGVVPVSTRVFQENYNDYPWVRAATGGKGVTTWGGEDSIDFEAIAAQKLTDCYQCGALVHDTDTHATWHAWLFDRLGVPREGA
jgi:ABC-type Fe3+-hydroxamate transport system substrate-binding protein